MCWHKQRHLKLPISSWKLRQACLAAASLVTSTTEHDRTWIGCRPIHISYDCWKCNYYKSEEITCPKKTLGLAVTRGTYSCLHSIQFIYTTTPNKRPTVLCTHTNTRTHTHAVGRLSQEWITKQGTITPLFAKICKLRSIQRPVFTVQMMTLSLYSIFIHVPNLF